MGNLNRFRKDWKRNLIPILQSSTGEKLQEFDKLKLLTISQKELQNDKERIMQCYGKLRSQLGPTAAGKLLHLLCPNFFPLWDAKIREDTKKAYKKNYENKIPSDTSSKDFYFEFIKIHQNFIKKYNESLKKTGEQWYNKPLLRMSDIYFWTLSNKARSFIEY